MPYPTISREELRRQMNDLGRKRIPFIWGVDFDASNGFVRDDIRECREILWSVNGVGNIDAEDQCQPQPSLRIVEVTDIRDYRSMFDTVTNGLMRGDSFLTNLTVRTKVTCSCSLKELFCHVKAPYKILIGDEFVCFSPEPFVRISEGRISTYPMKGTIDASIPHAEETLMTDYKELCEHYTIVDLMRNDLNSVAENVRVDRFRYVEKIFATNKTILQTSSEISGSLPAGKEFDFGDLILPLLPAGSITGAPKEATVCLIKSAEDAPRGWYTGVFGFFDGKIMDSAVMIRCVQRDNDGSLYFHSGGGITINSQCDNEYQEVLTKVYLPQ